MEIIVPQGNHCETNKYLKNSRLLVRTSMSRRAKFGKTEVPEDDVVDIVNVADDDSCNEDEEEAISRLPSDSSSDALHTWPVPK